MVTGRCLRARRSSNASWPCRPDTGGASTGDDATGGAVERSADGRRHWLYAEELGGRDRISLDPFLLADGRPLLKSCEMPEAKVVAFVVGYRPDAKGAER